MPASKFHVSMPDTVLAEVERRGARSTIITRDLERYYTLLAHERGVLRALLRPAAVGLICDALNGSRYDAQTIRLLPAAIEDAIRYDRLDAKWDVDGADLIARLRDLTLLQRAALADAVERFWEGPYHKEDVDWATVLA